MCTVCIVGIIRSIDVAPVTTLMFEGKVSLCCSLPAVYTWTQRWHVIGWKNERKIGHVLDEILHLVRYGVNLFNSLVLVNLYIMSSSLAFHVPLPLSVSFKHTTLHHKPLIYSSRGYNRRTTRPRPISTPDLRTDRWSPENLGFLHIATIVGPHGVRGEAKFMAEGQFAVERLGGRNGGQLVQKYLLLPGRRYPRPVELGMGRKASQNNLWILKIHDTHNREDVMTLRGSRIYVKDKDRPNLGYGEYMVGDLVGLKVILIDGSTVGVVDSVITRQELCTASGAGDKAAAVASDLIQIAVYDLDQHDEIPENAKRVMVPFVKDIVPEVNMEQGHIHVDPPKGLFQIAVVNQKLKKIQPKGLLMPAKHQS